MSQGCLPLGDIGIVLGHGDDKGDDEKAAHHKSKLTAFLLRLFFALEIGLSFVVLELGPARVR